MARTRTARGPKEVGGGCSGGPSPNHLERLRSRPPRAVDSEVVVEGRRLVHAHPLHDRRPGSIRTGKGVLVARFAGPGSGLGVPRA